ncbi:MAG: hypothetical protein QME59_00485 [Candidatus Hydrothermarchaeota archaeon]|nr:hypothetical protein [Candidatus Hydrothermarchaeota archaeon]
MITTPLRKTDLDSNLQGYVKREAWATNTTQDKITASTWKISTIGTSGTIRITRTGGNGPVEYRYLLGATQTTGNLANVNDTHDIAIGSNILVLWVSGDFSYGEAGTNNIMHVIACIDGIDFVGWRVIKQ